MSEQDNVYLLIPLWSLLIAATLMSWQLNKLSHLLLAILDKLP